MDCLKQDPILSTLLKPFRRSQQKTCAALIGASCHCAQASSFAIGGQLSCLTGVGFGSALNRLYRFLRNGRFDNWLLTEQMLRLLGKQQGPLLLAQDDKAVETHRSLCERALAAATPQNVQVVDGSPKVISGQEEISVD